MHSTILVFDRILPIVLISEHMKGPLASAVYKSGFHVIMSGDPSIRGNETRVPLQAITSVDERDERTRSTDFRVLFFRLNQRRPLESHFFTRSSSFSLE